VPLLRHGLQTESWGGGGAPPLKKMISRHLDLGCGTTPRNPYQCDELYGIDIRDGLSAAGAVQILPANLVLEPIPFPDSYFDSISAYDFLEHIPRISIDHNSNKSHLPFVELMNEISRVLKPGGKFYAVFPAYPHQLSFTDPTHVNILTDKSYRYFTGKQPIASMYGFRGSFELIRQKRIHPRGDFHPNSPLFKLKIKMLFDGLMKRRSHLIWEFSSAKF
jgi:SAM-dependent methyltransferase